MLIKQNLKNKTVENENHPIVRKCVNFKQGQGLYKWPYL